MGIQGISFANSLIANRHNHFEPIKERLIGRFDDGDKDKTTNNNDGNGGTVNNDDADQDVDLG